MTSSLLILVYAVGPFLMAFAIIQIQRRLRRRGRDVPSRKDTAASAYLADELERLMALPLTTAEDAERWDEERDRVKQQLAERFPQFEPEEEVWHFFDDADIRARDAGYRERQHGLMAEYVRRLRLR
jgi:hypothetical protein